MHASFLRPRLLHLWRLFKRDSKLYFPMWKACGQRIRPCNILRWVSLAVLGVFFEKWPGMKTVKKDFFAFEWLALTQPTFIGCQALQRFSVSLNYMAPTLCTCTFLCMSNRLHTLIYTIHGLCSVTDQATNPLNLSHLTSPFHQTDS